MLKRIFLPILCGVFAVGMVGGAFLLWGESEGDEVFARGSLICPGEVSGTISDLNPNFGSTTFSRDWVETVDLTVVGLGETGRAPGKTALLPCVNKPITGGSYLGDPYDYSLRGWAWNDNLGFISLNCSGSPGDLMNHSSERAHEISSCGDQPYGVYLKRGGEGEEDRLIGHAWNPAFGWIQFAGRGSQDGTPFFYGVTRNPETQQTSGYAWTQAGLWMDMSGITIVLPDEEAIPLEDCDPDDEICIEGPGGTDHENGNGPGVLTPLKRGVFSLDDMEDVKIADGEDYYELRLYLRVKDEEEGEMKPLIPEGEELGDYIRKLGRGDEADQALADFLKSIEFDWDNQLRLNISKPFNEEDNNAVIDLPKTFEGGGFDRIYKEHPDLWVAKIRSYAPTSNSNVSFTTSTDPSARFSNEVFLAGGEDAKVDGPNYLILREMTWQPVGEDETRSQTIGARLEFRPAMEVVPLYVDDSQDVFNPNRWIDIVTVGARLHGAFEDDQDLFSDENIRFVLEQTYSDDFNEDAGELNFKLVENDGRETGRTFNYSNLIEEIFLAVKPDYEIKDRDAAPFDDLQYIELSLYSEIEYEVDGGSKTVRYFSNKIPRLPGGVGANPVLIVHGAIQAHLDRAIGEEEGVVDTSGRVNMRTGRETIARNLAPYTAGVGLSGAECEITDLSAFEGNGNVNDCEYRFTRIGRTGENLLYLRQDVVIALGEAPEERWVIVTEGGNIFIDGDIYKDGATTPNIALVALRDRVPDRPSGHIYIAPKVTDIQAVLLADGAVFSYSGNKEYGDDEHIKLNGMPNWSNFAERADVLRKQLVILGAVSSVLNTLGGAHWDIDRILVGGRMPVDYRVADAESMLEAQSYDLNYLRLYKLRLEFDDEGYPIDQSCGLGLRPEDIIRLADGEKVTRTAENEEGYIDHDCQGIDTTSVHVEGDPDSGDLVVDPDELAKSIRPGDFGPVYIYQATMVGPSIIFER